MSTFAPYNDPPFAGILFVSGTGAPQIAYDGVLSYEADAQAYVAGINAKITDPAQQAKLFNAAADPRYTFVGVKSTDAAQPWAVEFGSGTQSWFAGIAINQQVAATFKLIGSATTQYPGTWQEQVSGVWLFIPNPVVAPAPTPVVSNSGDAASWAAILGVTTQTPQQFQTTVLQALAAIVLATGAKPPTS